jgi:hypothetical protein
MIRESAPLFTSWSWHNKCTVLCNGAIIYEKKYTAMTEI